LGAKGIAHRARNDLELLIIHCGECDKHHKEAHHKAHKIRERDEPAVPSAMRIAALLFGHRWFPTRAFPLLKESEALLYDF
jgi:hypothetical protein